jgi:hypothetical protein
MQNRKQLRECDDLIASTRKAYTRSLRIWIPLAWTLAYASLSLISCYQNYELAYLVNVAERDRHSDDWEAHCHGRNRAMVTTIVLVDGSKINCTEKWEWWEMDLVAKSEQDAHSFVWIAFKRESIYVNTVLMCVLWCLLLYGYRLDACAKWIDWQHAVSRKDLFATAVQTYQSSLRDQLDTTKIIELALQKHELDAVRKFNVEFDQEVKALGID